MDSHNGLTLAYLGDAWLELQVRHYLVNKGFTRVNDLHKRAITYISTQAMAKAARSFQENIFLDHEQAVFQRGRNAKTDRRPKNGDLAEYHQATGLEAVFGYLYLNGEEERMQELFVIFIKTIEELSS